MASSNRFVVALDLTGGQYVSAPIDPADPYVRALKRKSLAGDRTLVCALCYAELGRTVPVVVRARLGGSRRPHFAHPPGYAPPSGEHHPETLWHFDGKAMLARWAQVQPNVVAVRIEAWLPDRARRSDVRVVFSDGREVALEVQGSLLTDEEWTRRHDDYRRNDVVDVWLWRPESRPHWIVLSDPDRPQQLWSLDPAAQRSVALSVGAPHRNQQVEERNGHDIAYRAPHLPPCVGDELTAHRYRLADLELTSQGITIPETVRRSITLELRREHKRAEARRQFDRRRKQAASLSAPRPVPQAPPDTRIINNVAEPRRPATSRAAAAQLKWIELENTFMRAGHVPAYQDSPRLRRPRGPHQHVQCGHCAKTLLPNTAPADIEACMPIRPPTPLDPRSPLTPPTSRSRPPAPDQLSLF
ncbi:competence protein CoiA family protein [Nocardia salmonicida]|uniref:competence protein CoiA family protein n=1 Tax=Nocardia salmonicida TaxID=53431 RepID=UPI003CEF0FB2